MGCARIALDPNSKKPTGFICGRGVQACRFCGVISVALCDYPVAPSKTCDAPLCEHHRIKQGAEWQDLDFCPTHALIASGRVNPPPKE